MNTDPLENVSRETSEKLEAFVALVQKWTAKINLISKSDAEEIWQRHIMDSAQVFDLAPSRGKWVDFGSGGGFPAIVVGILSQGARAQHEMVLVESDQRKAVFLRTALRELELDGTVLTNRIETLDPLGADIISARALANLSTLLAFADRHMSRDGIALFHKGAQWQKEDVLARQTWSYACDVVQSSSNADAAILKIKEIARD